MDGDPPDLLDAQLGRLCFQYSYKSYTGLVEKGLITSFKCRSSYFHLERRRTLIKSLRVREVCKMSPPLPNGFRKGRKTFDEIFLKILSQISSWTKLEFSL